MDKNNFVKQLREKLITDYNCSKIIYMGLTKDSPGLNNLPKSTTENLTGIILGGCAVTKDKLVEIVEKTAADQGVETRLDPRFLLKFHRQWYNVDVHVSETVNYFQLHPAHLL